MAADGFAPAASGRRQPTILARQSPWPTLETTRAGSHRAHRRGMASSGNTTCPPRGRGNGPRSWWAEMGLAVLGPAECPGKFGSQKWRTRVIIGTRKPHTWPDAAQGETGPTRRWRCPSWGPALLPKCPGGSGPVAACSSSHATALGLYLPIDICHPWERFFSPLQTFPSNHRGPETCVKPKPPKYPMKSQQNPSNPGDGTSRKKTTLVHREPPWGSRSQTQALPRHRQDSLQC